MAVKKLKPKQAPVPVYDEYAVAQSVNAANARYMMQQEMMSQDDFGGEGVAWAKSAVTTEPKTIMYQSAHGSERIGLGVHQDGEYGSLEVEMTTDMGMPQYLTANIPECEKLAYNEAYLDNENKRFKSDFIKDNQLGKILPMSKSGAKGYNKIVFDMDKLSEFDPIGVEEYMSQMEIEGRLPTKQQSVQQTSVEQNVQQTTAQQSQRSYPSVAYDMGIAELDMQAGELSRPLPSMGEDLLTQVQAGNQVEDIGFGY